MLEQESEAREEKSDSPQDSQQIEYQRLRTLMLGEDYEEILKAQLGKPSLEQVSEVITEAFKKRSLEDDSLAQEMAPVIESAIDESIKNTPERITNVIFPIIGPAVRKAVSSSIADLMQSLNLLLQNSLSVKSLFWRLKAWRLGMSYGKYVLLQSIQHQVEQIFLIHRESGLLIQSAQAEGVTYQDPDLVSSMLTAISDFAQDSFDQDTEALDTLQLGDLTILVETGPHAVLAFAVRGTLNNDIKQVSSQLIEKIHAEFANELSSFAGDTNPFDPCVKYLEQALVKQEKTETKSKPWLAIVAVLIISLVIGYFIYKDIQLEKAIVNTVELVNNQKGYRVLSHQYDNNMLTLDVLKSPLAISQVELINKLPTTNLEIKFNQKLASIENPELYIPYLAYKYKIDLTTLDGHEKPILVASGEVTKDNLMALQKDPFVVNHFVFQESPMIRFKKNLTERQIITSEFIQLAQRINNHYYYFEVASATLTKESRDRLSQVIVDLRRLLALRENSDLSITQIGIFGFADAQGGRAKNMALSQDRAQSIKSILQENDIDNQLIISWGAGSRDLDSVPTEFQRRARIEVLYIQVGATSDDQ